MVVCHVLPYSAAAALAAKKMDYMAGNRAWEKEKISLTKETERAAALA